VRVIDIKIERSRGAEARMIFRFVVFAVACLLLIVLARMLEDWLYRTLDPSHPQWWMIDYIRIGTVMSVLAIGPFWVWRKYRRAAHEVTAAISTETSNNRSEQIRRAFGSAHSFGAVLRAGLIAKRLADAGDFGNCYRIVEGAFDPHKVRPFGVPFEPTLLQKGDEAFDQLSTLGGNREESGVSVGRSSTSGVWSLWIGRHPKAFALFTIVPYTVFTAWTVATTGRANVLIYYIALLAFILLAPKKSLRSSASTLTRQVFLVPGGVVLRTSRLMSEAWKLHVFKRSSSVLLTVVSDDAAIPVHLIDADERIKLNLSGAELDCLLRAWTSPLDPPGEDRLSDLV
jgi:hypothetical protein